MNHLHFTPSVDNTHESKERVQMDDVLRQRFPGAFIDSELYFPEPEYTLSVDDTPIAARANLLGISGHAKAGKTTALTMIVASLLGDKRFRMRSLLPPDARVLITDSDQSSFFSARVKRRIQRMLGWPTDKNQDRLAMMNLRRIAAEERLSAVCQMMETLKPAVVVVDNVAHFGVDINDSQGSRQLVDELCRLAETHNCLIIVVLHTNKSAEDTNMKGHLGSMVQEACSDILQVRHPSGSPTHEIVHLFARDACFGRLAFQFGADGLPILTETAREMEEKARVQAAVEECQRNMLTLLNGCLPMTYTTLKTDYMNRFGVGETKAKEQIKLASENNFISKTDAGLYVLTK